MAHWTTSHDHWFMHGVGPIPNPRHNYMTYYTSCGSSGTQFSGCQTLGFLGTFLGYCSHGWKAKYCRISFFWRSNHILFCTCWTDVNFLEVYCGIHTSASELFEENLWAWTETAPPYKLLSVSLQAVRDEPASLNRLTGPWICSVPLVWYPHC